MTKGEHAYLLRAERFLDWIEIGRLVYPDRTDHVGPGDTCTYGPHRAAHRAAQAWAERNHLQWPLRHRPTVQVRDLQVLAGGPDRPREGAFYMMEEIEPDETPGSGGPRGVARVLKTLEELNPEALLLEPRTVFDAAIVGICREPQDRWKEQRQPDTWVAVYSMERAAEALVKDWEEEGANGGGLWNEAVDYIAYNSMGGWVGPHTPTWIDDLEGEAGILDLGEAGILVEGKPLEGP